MPYIIDGHNLIPKLGLQLRSMDDELELVDLLQEFCRSKRTTVEVFFDGAPPGTTSPRKFGAVRANFIRSGSSADAAIETRLGGLGRQARNWILVSSDGRVQSAGKAAHAKVLSSEEFAKIIHGETRKITSKPDQELKSEEINEWLDLFKQRK